MELIQNESVQRRQKLIREQNILKEVTRRQKVFITILCSIATLLTHRYSDFYGDHMISTKIRELHQRTYQTRSLKAVSIFSNSATD